MVRWLISVAIHLGANAIALWIADLILDDLHIEWSAFIMAVAIFTLVEVLVEPLLTKVALSSMPALRGSVALIATFVGLLVTSLVSEGLDIDGVSTWILATIIVWLGGLLAGIILPMIFLKRAVDDEPGLGRPEGKTYKP
jgi:putative membrane protein